MEAFGGLVRSGSDTHQPKLLQNKTTCQLSCLCDLCVFCPSFLKSFLLSFFLPSGHAPGPAVALFVATHRLWKKGFKRKVVKEK